jgi:hypothetical protein
MSSTPLTLDQLRNISYPENSPERVQQKAQEDKAVGTFVEAMKKFDYADSNPQKRELELEVAKVKDRTGVQVRYESSFWNKGSLVFPKEMTESSVRATLVKVTKGREALPINGNHEEGYSVAISDLASAAPDLVKEAKAEQQKEVIDLKAAQTNAANKVLEAHGWDLTGHNHRLHKHNSPADRLLQTAAVSPKAVTASTVNPPAAAAEIHAATTYAPGDRPPVLSKPESIGVEETVVAQTLPEKTQHLSHRTQLKAQNATTVAEIRELVEKTRLAALESGSASQDTIRLLSVLHHGRAFAANPPAAEIHAATTYAPGDRPPALSKPESIGVEKTVVAQTLPEKKQHLSHRTQLKAQNATTVAEIRELVEKTRLAALESANASQDAIRLLSVLRHGRTLSS